MLLIALAFVLGASSPVFSGNVTGIDFTTRIEPAGYDMPEKVMQPVRGNMVQTKTKGLSVTKINSSHNLLLRYNHGNKNTLTNSEQRNDYGNAAFDYAIPW
jgi:hypothetical protein